MCSSPVFSFYVLGQTHTKQIRGKKKPHKTLCSIETTLQSLVFGCDRNFIPWLVPKLQKQMENHLQSRIEFLLFFISSSVERKKG